MEAGHVVAVARAQRKWLRSALVVDLRIPTTNGWQFAEAYARLAGRRAPVIAITAAGPSAVQSVGDRGAIAAGLAKPLRLEVFLDVIRQHAGAVGGDERIGLPPAPRPPAAARTGAAAGWNV